ncbi:DUF1272 domain-containing protein [Peribacillus kribbensis]|uniref:DUF1272 domain-containing protein n=1 Tax=Peribacillus kribbensis TaxID=356658 RepID=UPI003CCBC2E9
MREISKELHVASGAYICTYECTYCPGCSEEMELVCPNCGGELVKRPKRRIESSPERIF